MPPPPFAQGFASRLLLGPALRAQPDQRLVQLVREGYETAFDEIVRRYGKPLQRYAAGIVGGNAEDITQDAFAKALLAMRRDDREIQLRPWLYRIVRNTALNDIRDRPPPAQVLEEAIQSGAGPEEVAERRAEVADLMKRLRSLPEPQRAAIVMRELEGLGHEEIAAALGLSDGAARQAIYRARRALRDGAGLLVPLPLVRLLIEHGPETALAAGASGAAVAGVGTATKVGVVTVLVAGSVGAGVALEERSSPDPARAAASTGVPERSGAGATANAGTGPRRSGHRQGATARSYGPDRTGVEQGRPDLPGWGRHRRGKGGRHRGSGPQRGPGGRPKPALYQGGRRWREPELHDRPHRSSRAGSLVEDDRRSGGRTPEEGFYRDGERNSDGGEPTTPPPDERDGTVQDADRITDAAEGEAEPSRDVSDDSA